VIALPQLNMATSDTNAALPEKVKPETPQPPASSDISAMFQQILSGQDNQADHNCGVKAAQDHQKDHDQTVAGFMGAQLSHNDKQQSFNDKQQSFNDKQQSFNDDQKIFNMNLHAFSTKQQEFNDNQEVFNDRINQFVQLQKLVNQQLNQALSKRTESTSLLQMSVPSRSVTPAGPLLSSQTNQLHKEHSKATSEDNNVVSSPLNRSRIGGDAFKGARVGGGGGGGSVGDRSGNKSIDRSALEEDLGRHFLASQRAKDLHPGVDSRFEGVSFKLEGFL
jgi:hypothetical protein